MKPQKRAEHARALRELRAALAINQEQMGRLLGVTREWVGKLEREKEDFSEFILMKMEATRQTNQRGEHTSHFETDEERIKASEAPQSDYYGPSQQRSEVLSDINEALDIAGGDPNRLGWLVEQIRKHINPTVFEWNRRDAEAKKMAVIPSLDEAPRDIPDDTPEKLARIEALKAKAPILPPVGITPLPITKDHERALRVELERAKQKEEERKKAQEASSLKTQSGAGR